MKYLLLLLIPMQVFAIPPDINVLGFYKHQMGAEEGKYMTYYIVSCIDGYKYLTTNNYTQNASGQKSVGSDSKTIQMLENQNGVSVPSACE